MRSLLTAIIPTRTIAFAQQQIANIEAQTDLFELRLDYLEHPSLTALKAIVAYTHRPYILTLRNKAHGGLFRGNERARLQLIKELLTVNPAYIDIEIDVASEFIEEIHQLAPRTKIIRSFHDFHTTPKNLATILQRMLHPAVAIYKIVTHANSSLDALHMMNFVKQHATKHKIIGHCMGEDGLFSRLAGPVVGNHFTYASIDDNTRVVGHQATLQTLRETYYLQQKNRDTKLFALLGDPITFSQGHEFHNKRFAEHNINALYVKIRLQANELAAFFAHIAALPFAGFSVTMPLKKRVLPYVDNPSGLRAVNTLVVKADHITATNTDGIGALDAIEDVIKVKNKNVLVLGAGGAATAIVQTAQQRGANITIANRTIENAQKIKCQFPCQCIDFLSLPNNNYDLVINTLPITAYQQSALITWLKNVLQQQPIVMDVNYNCDKNLLLDFCQEFNCITIRGEAMFTNQAIAQFNYWYG